MNSLPPRLLDTDDEIASLNIIRTETALSRFPIHRLSKSGHVQIDIRNQAAAILWEVTYNSKYGQPGPLAYKLDTLIVNRRIEEAGHPIPAMIRLGSLRDICRELGNSEGGESLQSVRKVLHQNSSAYINAKISYRGTDRSEKTLEAAFTRYAVIFTGETLPDGRSADAVYLVLSDVYLKVLEAALTRPLDYDYMKALPPSAQRFYEIASYQIYGALHHKNERAKLRYSEYCLLSTATRYFTFDQVKKQMYKVHRPHLEHGYIAKISYEPITDSEGRADWLMYYVPGPNADREYREFTGNIYRNGTIRKDKRRAPQVVESLLLPFSEFEIHSKKKIKELIEESGESKTVSSIVEKLLTSGLNRADADRFSREKPEECIRQLEYLAFKEDLENPGAYLRRAIEGSYAPPKKYIDAQKQQKRQQQRQEEAARKRSLQEAEEIRRRDEAYQVDQEIARMEVEAPEAFTAFLSYVDSERERIIAKFDTPRIREVMLKDFARPEKRRELFLEWQVTRDGLLPGSSTTGLFGPALD